MQAVSRVLISAGFIVFGYDHVHAYRQLLIANPVVIKVAGWTGILTHQRSSPLWSPRLISSVRILILVGYQTRWASVVLIVFVALTCILVHNFWTMEGPARAANQGNFYKNLALIGGLLLIYVQGPGTCSLEHRFGKKT